MFINVLNPVCVSYDGVGHEKMHENQNATIKKENKKIKCTLKKCIEPNMQCATKKKKQNEMKKCS